MNHLSGRFASLGCFPRAPFFEKSVRRVGRGLYTLEKHTGEALMPSFAGSRRRGEKPMWLWLHSWQGFSRISDNSAMLAVGVWFGCLCSSSLVIPCQLVRDASIPQAMFKEAVKNRQPIPIDVCLPRIVRLQQHLPKSRPCEQQLPCQGPGMTGRVRLLTAVVEDPL